MTSMQSAQPRLDVDDPLLDGLLILCKLHGCPASRAGLCSGLPLADQRLPLNCCPAPLPAQGFRHGYWNALWPTSRNSTCRFC